MWGDRSSISCVATSFPIQKLYEYSRRAFTAARSKLGKFAYGLYPNYEQRISGFCHLSRYDKRIDSLILS
jgi:hypothetical protein